MRKRGHEDTLDSDHKEEILELVERYISDCDPDSITFKDIKNHVKDVYGAQVDKSWLREQVDRILTRILRQRMAEPEPMSMGMESPTTVTASCLFVDA